MLLTEFCRCLSAIFTAWRYDTYRIKIWCISPQLYRKSIITSRPQFDLNILPRPEQSAPIMMSGISFISTRSHRTHTAVISSTFEIFSKTSSSLMPSYICSYSKAYDKRFFGFYCSLPQIFYAKHYILLTEDYFITAYAEISFKTVFCFTALNDAYIGKRGNPRKISLINLIATGNPCKKCSMSVCVYTRNYVFRIIRHKCFINITS